MPALRCPRCATIVHAPASGTPTCPGCGFGQRAAPPAGGPARPGASAAPGRPAAPAAPPAIAPASVAGTPWPPPPANLSGPLKPLAGLATAVAVLLPLYVACSAASFLMEYSPEDEPLRVTDGLLLVATVGYIGAAITLLVLLIVFTHRARANLDQRRGPPLKWSRGWAIAGWLVPFANAVVPYLVLSEVERAGRAAPGRPLPAASRLLGMWWGALFAHMALSNAWGQVEPGSAAEGPLALAAIVLSIPAAVLTAVALRRIARDQEQAFAGSAAAQAPGAAGAGAGARGPSP